MPIIKVRDPEKLVEMYRNGLCLDCGKRIEDPTREEMEKRYGEKATQLWIRT